MRINDHKGYSLIELVVVIVIFGIIATVAVRSLQNSVEVTRTVETTAELDLLAAAIVGDPAMKSGGTRTDFGYVGDVGALPPSLDALVTNPGLATWNGPYIRDQFSSGGNTTFKQDGWGQNYLYTGGTTITSPAGVTRQLAYSSDDLLANDVTVTISDLDYSTPGAANIDSVRFELTYPDGAGGYTTTQVTPMADGYASFSNIPIGSHDLRVIFINTADTLRRKITVTPGERYYADLSHYADIWGGVDDAGSATLDEGLVAFYEFNDGSGGTAVDATGNGHTGTLTNMNPASDWVGGHLGGALDFDGNNDEVLADDSDLLDDTTAMSFCAWVYPTTLDGNPRGILSKRVTHSNNNSYGIFFYGGNRLNVDIVSNNNRFASSQTFTANQWYHIAVVFDGTLPASERVTLYVNGAVDRTAYEASDRMVNTSSELSIGQLNGNSSGFFEGRIDDVRIYARALTAGEVSTLAAE